MSPNEVANQIEQLILSANEKYAKTIAAIERSMYNRIAAVLKDLEVNKDGYIIQNAANRRLIKEAENIYYDTISSAAYVGSLQKYVSIIPKIDKLNQDYFSQFGKFKDNKNYFKSLQNQVVNDMNTYILQDGVSAAIRTPLVEILNRNINSGGQFAGFLEEVKTFIVGNDTEGKLLRYARNQTRDILFNYSRAYQQAVTADLGLEFYVWSGGLTGTSRDFCKVRAGKYFHHNEIESWASQSWSGKHAGTTEASIFIYAGGYGCGHTPIPVDVSAVPSSDIDRNVKNGNYKR